MSAEAVKHDDQSDHPIGKIEHLGPRYLGLPEHSGFSAATIEIFTELIGKVLRYKATLLTIGNSPQSLQPVQG